jgi:hypothetical protein
MYPPLEKGVLLMSSIPMNRQILIVRRQLKARHHDHLLIAWAASAKQEGRASAAKGSDSGLPYIPSVENQIDTARDLIAWGLLNPDYTITELGMAVIEYDETIGHAFLEGDDPPEEISIWGPIPV